MTFLRLYNSSYQFKIVIKTCTAALNRHKIPKLRKIRLGVARCLLDRVAFFFVGITNEPSKNNPPAARLIIKNKGA